MCKSKNEFYGEASLLNFALIELNVLCTIAILRPFAAAAAAAATATATVDMRCMQ